MNELEKLVERINKSGSCLVWFGLKKVRVTNARIGDKGDLEVRIQSGWCQVFPDVKIEF